MSKTTALTPEEWKQLCILNVVQLKNFLDQLATPTPEHMKLIDDHMARWHSFMAAWASAKPIGEAHPQEQPSDEPAKRKRGRPPKPKPEAVQ